MEFRSWTLCSTGSLDPLSRMPSRSPQTYKVDCHFTTCSIILRSMNICSTVLRPLLNPACSSLNLLFTPFLILSIITLPNTLLGIDVNVIPLQLSHSFRSPFLGNLTLSPCFHVFGTSSLSQIVSNRSASQLTVVSMSTFNNSPVILSFSPDFQFFNLLIAALISAFEMWLVLMSSITLSLSLITLSDTGLSGIGRLRTPSKCSRHLFFLAVSSVIRFPDLSFTARLVLPLP